ncbi:hypothetical protein DMENIID0001_040100 [Sergentomyia squamirostris]
MKVKKKKPLYAPEAMSAALNAVKGGMSVHEATRTFQVPRTTLRNKVSGKSPSESIGHGGFYSALGKEVEDEARGGLTEAKIRYWFDDIFKHLGPDAAILNLPHRVFNMDETCFNLCPNGNLVLGIKGHVCYMESAKSDKDNITTLFTVDACGNFYQPLTLYKFKRLPSHFCTSAPLGWGIGNTESGWMDAAAFYEYIGNVFLPELKERNVERPVVVFLDGHSSHLTLHLSRFCQKNGIILVSLYPNSTHLTQPLDVAVFKPIKTRFSALKTQFSCETRREPSKPDLPHLLNCVISEPLMKTDVIAGFRACGLFPYNPDALDYSKIIVRDAQGSDEFSDLVPLDPSAEAEKRNQNVLQCIESRLDPQLLKDFRNTVAAKGEWTGEKDANLFELWKTILYEQHPPPEEEIIHPEERLDSPSYVLNDSPSSEQDMSLAMYFPPATEVSPLLAFNQHRPTDQDACFSFSLPIEIPVNSQTSRIHVPLNESVPIASVKQVLNDEIIRYPVKPATRKRKRKDVPSVLTGQQWRDFFEAEEEAKKQKIEEKEERKVKRQEKKIKDQQDLEAMRRMKMKEKEERELKKVKDQEMKKKIREQKKIAAAEAKRLKQKKQKE